MEEKGISEEKKTFDFSRNLTSIDEYARKQGVSTELVKRCAKLGVVKVRKFRGQTFVIDNSLTSKEDLLENLDMEPEENEEEALSLDVKEEKNFDEDELFEPEHNESVKEPTREDVNREMQKLNNIMQQAKAKSASNSYKKAAEPKQEINDDTDVPGNIDAHRLRDIKQKFQNESDQKQEEARPGFIRIMANRLWQVVAVILFTMLLVAGLSAAWLYMNNQVNVDRLNETKAALQTTAKDTTNYKQKAQQLQNKLVDTKSELGKIEAGYEASQAEILSLKKELSQAKSNIKEMRNKNNEAIERLNKQIIKLKSLQK